MRALFVINNPVFGGAHSELLSMRPRLADAGWDVVALTPQRGSTEAERLRSAGVEVTTVPLHRLRATLNPASNAALVTRFWPEVAAIRRVIREQGVDLVQVHGAVNPHGAVAARMERVAVCWHVYDMYPPKALRRLVSRVVVRYADVATVVGRALLDAYPGLERMGARAIVTPPAADLDRFTMTDAMRGRARELLEVPRDAVVIGTVGNRFPVKGHLDLMQAGLRLARRDPRIVVAVIGGPSPGHRAYDEQLEALAAAQPGRVRLIDPGDRVPELLPGLDVFVLASRSEGMPVSVLEAMSCALPVIATDVGAVREEILDGTTGLLVPPGDAGALDRAIASLVDDPGRRAALGAAGRDRARREFNLDGIIVTRLRAYETALEHCRRRTGRQRFRARRRSGRGSNTRR